MPDFPKTRIKFRRGTAAEFSSANPVLASGEPGFAVDTNTLKIGDGSTAWNSLSGISGGGGGGGISNVVEDTTPQLGGNLDGQSKDISAIGNITAATGIYDVLDMTLISAGSEPAHSEGLVWYDSDNHALIAYNDEAEVTQQLGQEEYLRVRNNTGDTILNGKVVRINGAHGNAAPTISLARADTEQDSQILGLATHDIEDSSFGYVTTYGLVRSINTSGLSSGDELFLSASVSGAMVNSAPVIPNYKVTVGYVVASGAANGSVLVKSGFSKLGGGDLKSSSQVNHSGVPFADSVADSNAGSLATVDTFIFDSGNTRLGINTAYPSHHLSVSGDINAQNIYISGATAVKSDTTGIVGASGVSNIVYISSGDYAALGSYHPTTIYFVR